VAGAGFWLGSLRAVGPELLFSADSGLGVLDATDLDAPTLEIHDLYGWGCWGMEVGGDKAYCPMGEFGLQVIAF
jgi:hypothetical protein